MGVEKVSKSVKLDIKEALKSVLPQIFEDNKVNLNELKSLLSGEIVEKEDDRFYFNWAGKNGLFRLIQAPAYETLKLDKKKSVDPEKTENLVIVGENLETLKLLLKPYFDKVKMIYIDPPYNTGNGFIYRDNFTEPLKNYLEKTGQVSSEGDRLTTNPESGGRYHSDWLNFMYSRLFIARSLLREDGVIFVSIDDNELHHLRTIMDEIFGEENFVGPFVIQTNPRGRFLDKYLASTHEYCLLYSKSIANIKIEGIELTDKQKEEYKYTDNKGRKYRLLGLRKRGAYSRKEERPNLHFPVYYDLKNNTISLDKKQGYVEMIPRLEDGSPGVWRWSKGKILVDMHLLEVRKVKDRYDVFQRDFLTEGKSLKPKTIWINKDFNYENGTELIKKIFGRKVYDFPKPLEYIEETIKIGCTKEDLVMDFFAGSGTSGHAVWDLNRKDGGRRKFITVQMDEPVDEKTEAGRNALNLGLKTVADICVERLKRVSDGYMKEKTLFGEHDFGFKVFRLDKSNFNLKDEFEISDEKDAKELKKKYLDWLGIWVKEPLVAGWKPLDVVYEVILKEGFDLNSEIEEIKIKSNDFLHVTDEKEGQEFYISLDDRINKATIEEIRTPAYKGRTFVFFDKALTDNDKINLKAFVRVKVI
jgi:adenine-specific DNA-methyltransferase